MPPQNENEMARSRQLMNKNSSMQVIPPVQRSSRIHGSEHDGLARAASGSGAGITDPTENMLSGDKGIAQQSAGNQPVSFAVSSSVAGSARDDLKSGPSRSIH